MKTIKLAMMAVGLLPLAAAHATTVLNTGTPNGIGPAVNLDSGDWQAAEFSLSAGQTINGIQVYLNNSLDFPASVGDTFTVSLYDAGSSFTGNHPSLENTWSATYNGDGWNGVSGDLGLSGLTAGNYWVAFEIGASDTGGQFNLFQPAAGTGTPALGYAFASQGDYVLETAQNVTPFGVQVDVAPVPLPSSVLLLGGGLLAAGGLLRRRQPSLG